MKRLSIKTDINKGQEVPSINLTYKQRLLSTLSNKVKPKKEVGGKARNKSSFLIFFYKCKRKTTYKAKHADKKNKTKGSLLYIHPTNSRPN